MSTRVEAEVGGHALLELLDPADVAVEQVELVLLRADRALDAAERVAGEQLVDAAVGLEELLAGVGEPLAERGRLRGHVVAAAGDDQRRVLRGALGQAGQRGHDPRPHELERSPHLQLLDVLGEVTGCHALVDLFVPGEGGELLDARLHVVAGDPFAGLDRRQIDRDRSRSRRPRSPRWARRFPALLGLEDRDPELALEHDLALG